VVEKKVLPFQQLMTRKRKDVKVEDVKVKVCVFAFDILYLNGEVSPRVESRLYIWMLTMSGTCHQTFPRTS
jgi:ATP-dependent DNA ligase